MASSQQHFRLRARVMEQLGEQLVKNENVALLELVKNSYDAGAREVTVELRSLDDMEKGYIVVNDDGWGMSYSTVLNSWLEIGTDVKARELCEFDAGRVPPHPQGYPVRPPLGEKGIGRFGAHKLGKQVELNTKAPDAREVHVAIDWDSFSEHDYLEEVPIRVEETDSGYFTDGKTGTRLVIRGLKATWTRGRARDLYRSIIALSSPFQSIDSFKVVIDTGSSAWFDNMGTAETLMNSALYRVKAQLSGREITKLTYDFTPWEQLGWNLARHVEKTSQELKVSSRKNGKTEYRTLDLDACGIGPVTMELRIFDLDTALLERGNISKSGLSRFLAHNGGIALYRDNVRLYEYGNRDNDWLELESARINNPSKTISSRISVGAVYLDRLKSSGLVEKASREGLVNNEAFETLKAAVNEVLRHVYPLRNADKDRIRVAQRGVNAREPVYDEIKELQLLIGDLKVDDVSQKRKLEQSLKRIEGEYESIVEQYSRGASAALALGTVVHEIGKIIDELKAAIQAEGATEHVNDLVKSLSETTNAYASFIRKAQKKPETARTLVGKALTAVKYRLRAHGIKVADCTPEGGARFMSSNLLLGTVVNIIDNSIYWIEFSGKAVKELFITAERSDESVRIVIADSGTGFLIDPSDAVRPFVTEKEGGMGIGLHLAAQVVADLGGYLEFPSPSDCDVPESCSKGACVVICLPITS